MFVGRLARRVHPPHCSRVMDGDQGIAGDEEMSESIWTVIIWVASHSTGNGAANDQKVVGGSIQRFTIDSVKFSDAFELAKAIEQGIRSNPMVWETELLGIIRVDMESPPTAAGGVR